MDVGVGPLGNEGIELAEPGGVESHLGLGGQGPAIVQRHGRAADLGIFGRRGKTEGDQRQYKHERLCHRDLTYVVRAGGQGHVSVCR